MKSFLDVLKNPVRLFFFAISLLLLSFPMYFYKLLEVKTAITNIIPLCDTSYSIMAQVIELIGWSVFIGTFSHFFWQIRSGEYTKFLPIAIFGSAIIFIYTLCRQVKDAMLISAVSTEAVTSAKVLVIILNAVYFSLYYAKLSRKIHYKNYVIVAMVPIVVYYAIFNFYLFENPSVLPSKETLMYLNTFSIAKIPAVGYLLQLLGEWPKTLYYILSEIFSVVVLSTVFWKVANRFVSSKERPRFYPAMMITAQIASLLSGMVTVVLGQTKGVPFGQTLNTITTIVLIASLLVLFSNWFFFKYAVTEADAHEPKKKDGAEVNIISIIKENPKYLFVALLTVYYGFCSVFMEQFWKNTIKMTYTTQETYSAFMGTCIILQSRISLLFTMIVSNFFMKYVSWFWFAALTPLLVISGSLTLYAPFIFESFVHGIVGIAPALIVCIAGSYVIGLFKAVKYGSFDPSKEEYIAQQDFESRREIKDLEGMTNKIGKSGGALILSAIFGLTGTTYRSYSMSVGLWIATIFMGITWLLTVASISKDVKPKEELH